MIEKPPSPKHILRREASPMCGSDAEGHETHALGPLELKAYALLRTASKKGHFIFYNDAADALARLRIDRRTAMALLSFFSEAGLVESSCGHGIRITEEGENGGWRVKRARRTIPPSLPSSRSP